MEWSATAYSKNFPRYFRMWNSITLCGRRLGFNTGRGTARNGEINMTIPEGRSNEAFEIMFFVKPGMDEYFELTDEGLYKWVS